MAETDTSWKPGVSGNPGRGRPKGSKNKKTLLREELEKHGSELAAALKAKALEGDSTCLGLWLARVDPPIRPRGETVEFELDSKASLSAQIEQVAQAMASGELTVDEAKQIVDVLRQLAEVRALEGKGDGVQNLVEAFKQLAQNLPI
jgi:hypothetical protein